MTDNQILALFFQLINVSNVTTLIDGNVWLGEKPVDRISEDIVINMLTSKPEFNNQLLNGMVNINCFTRANEFHTRDAARVDVITNFVLTSLDIVLGEGTIGLLTYKLDGQKTFRDADNPVMYYSNIRLKFSYKQ